MNLKCMINGKISGVFLASDNDNNRLIQGNTISEEYSETLDSGSIILTDIKKIHNLDPYDDVFIWAPGIDNQGNEIDFTGFSSVPNLRFYKHFLLDRYTEERNLLNQDNYTYKIELFSETKGLETVILPNIVITQPLDANKRLSTFTYMQQFLEIYSPKIKVRVGNTWEYRQKYTLSQEMNILFRNHYCQQFTLNSPTLRELFTKLMVSKDCIPVVRDNVIYPLMLGKTTGQFNINDDEKSFIVTNKSSDGYVTQFRTNYNNALTAAPTCHRVEHLGFRNSDEAILTINNMRIETGFPIYRLNKVYLCYYKKCAPVYTSDPQSRDWHYFLCRQDITDFCVLANERQALYKDTRMAADGNLSLKEMQECYYYTFAYSIGSNLITGFGEMFEHLESSGLTTWYPKECIFRNLLNVLDQRYPYGVDGKANLLEKLNELLPSEHPDPSASDGYMRHADSVFVPSGIAGFGINENTPVVIVDDADSVPSIFLTHKQGDPLKVQGDSIVLKGITCQIDYEGFYNGAIMTNKETYKKQIMKVDNQSDSMPILNVDGIAKERKIEKMANKMYTITARYDKWEDVQNIGTVFAIGGASENQDDYEEIIVYHRDMAFYDNCINVTYFGQESFVLKNFYTSVFAKQRLYNILDYGNSVTRAENVKDILLFSKTKQYEIQPNILARYFNIKNYLSTLCKSHNTSSDNLLLLEYPIDVMRMEFFDIVQHETVSVAKYFADINTFTSGNSLCINTTMVDNLTMGTSIDKNHLSGKFWLDGRSWVDSSVNTNYAGTTQKLCSIHNDRKTGRSEYVKYTFGTSEERADLYHMTTDVAEWQIEKLELPLYNYNQETAVLGQIEKKLYKDVNETIDATFQMQMIVDKKDKKDIFLSDNLLKYNNLLRPKARKKTISAITAVDTVWLVPFQYIVKSVRSQPNPNYVNPTLYQDKSSMLGFIMRIPNDRMNELADSNYSIDFLFDINTDKDDMLLTEGSNADYIFRWRIAFRNSNNNLYFSPIKVNGTTIEFIRLNYYSVAATKRQGTGSNYVSSGDGYIYLEEIDKSFINDDESVDKSKFTYYTNVCMFDYFGANDPKKLPIINNYFKNNSIAVSLDHINEPSEVQNLAPCDYDIVFQSARYNNLMYGYSPTNFIPDPTTCATQTNGTSLGFTPFGVAYKTYVSNYFAYGRDVCDVNNVSKDMLSYTVYEGSSLGDYGLTHIDVFKDLDINTQAYFSWSLTTYEEEEDPGVLNNYTLICVGAPKIEVSLTDEKTKNFSDFPGYHILMNNGELLPYNSIFDISGVSIDPTSISAMPKSTGTLKIDLTNIPQNYVDDNDHSKGITSFAYESIQEWIYLSETNEYFFVCGFNITEKDLEEYNKYLADNETGSRYIEIYLSLVGNLDLEVYNSDGILIGYVANKAINSQVDIVDLP